MKILMIIAALMLGAGVALGDVVLGVCGFVSLASAAIYLLGKHFTASVNA